ncbi:CD3324 family protein [Paenibacillus marinisediminis]
MKKYINAKEVLPAELIQEIQKYVHGKHIYIPQTVWDDWGSSTGIRDEIDKRNDEIFRKYNEGYRFDQLAELFHLSEERIRGIIYVRKTN